MQLIDTHCHIHFDYYDKDPDEVLAAAREAGVVKCMLVGCTLPDSKAGIAFARTHPGTFAAIGLHPHEGIVYAHDEPALEVFAALAEQPEVKAIGECGLDYYYEHSPREDQKKLLHFQLALAQKHDLPLIFHVRDAFADFFEIFDQYTGLRGVIHSFTAHPPILDQVLARGLYVGLNGIMTFTKDELQLESAKRVPLEKLVLETDAPFLTPKPFRGKICEPKHVRTTAEFLSEIRGEPLELLAKATTSNAESLFSI